MTYIRLCFKSPTFTLSSLSLCITSKPLPLISVWILLKTWNVILNRTDPDFEFLVIGLKMFMPWALISCITYHLDQSLSLAMVPRVYASLSLTIKLYRSLLFASDTVICYREIYRKFSFCVTSLVWLRLFKCWICSPGNSVSENTIMLAIPSFKMSV